MITNDQKGFIQDVNKLENEQGVSFTLPRKTGGKNNQNKDPGNLDGSSKNKLVKGLGLTVVLASIIVTIYFLSKKNSKKAKHFTDK